MGPLREYDNVDHRLCVNGTRILDLAQISKSVTDPVFTRRRVRREALSIRMEVRDLPGSTDGNDAGCGASVGQGGDVNEGLWPVVVGDAGPGGLQWNPGVCGVEADARGDCRGRCSG